MSTTEQATAKESRIGKKPVVIPSGVKINVAESEIEVTGPKGTLRTPIPQGVTVAEEDGGLRLRAESGLTLVAAMHDLTTAGQYADRVLLVDGGRLVADGTPAEVFTEELLSRHYEASVEVLSLDGRLAVVPRRATAAGRVHG